jgi:hypothetical protein
MSKHWHHVDATRVAYALTLFVRMLFRTKQVVPIYGQVVREIGLAAWLDGDKHAFGTMTTFMTYLRKNSALHVKMKLHLRVSLRDDVRRTG